MRVHNARARLDEARAALRGLSLAARAAALERALDILADVNSDARRELEHALCPELSQLQKLVAALRVVTPDALPVELLNARATRESERAASDEELEKMRDGDHQIIHMAEQKLRAARIHPATLRAGLDCAFDAWRARGLRALAHSQLDPRGADAPGFECTAILCGGALPMPGIETALDALLLGSPVLLRPAARDLWSARALKLALAEAHPALGAAFEIVQFLNPAALDARFENPRAPGAHADLREERERWARFENSGDAQASAQTAARERAELEAFLDTECVVAYGGDETMRGLEASRGARAHNQRAVFYGHRFSVAIVARGAEQSAAAALARDVCLWDQLGCLSPTVVWTLGDADLLADALAEAIALRARVWPRGALPLDAAAAFARARAEVEMRAASGRARLLGGEHWLVAREADARFRGSPLYRALRVCPARDLAEFCDALAPVKRWLSSVGHAGFAGAKLRALLEACAALGPPRVTRIGQLQAPPLTWRHDGAGALLPLLKNPTPWEREHGEKAGLAGE